jgi:hypothetical protein
MTPGNFPSSAIGWMASAAGVAGLLGLITIILFFAVGQPFGTINDVCIGLAAILSAVLAWMLYARHQAQSPVLSQLALLAALMGALVVAIGSALVISGVAGWYLAGLYMAAGNALIGVWLLALNYSALTGANWPRGLSVAGIVVGIILMLGLATLPGILGGIDAWEAAPWYVNTIGQAGALGWLVLYPIWCILAGRMLGAS